MRNDAPSLRGHNRRALLTFSLFSLCALAQNAPGTFIPWSPLIATEVAERKKELQRGTSLSEATIDNLLKDETNYHTYRERDIFAAFPELRGARKLSECANSMMGGAAALVFIAGTKENEASIKTLQCSRARKGLSCGAVKREKRYFLDAPEDFFSLENLPFSTAKAIVEAYKADRIEGLPDWFGTSRPKVSLIKALPNGHYTMYFGEYYCAGCTARFDVRLESGGENSRLTVVGNVDGGCI